MENTKMELRIDPEFESKIPPLTADELARLHSSILFLYVIGYGDSYVG